MRRPDPQVEMNLMEDDDDDGIVVPPSPRIYGSDDGSGDEEDDATYEDPDVRRDQDRVAEADARREREQREADANRTKTNKEADAKHAKLTLDLGMSVGDFVPGDRDSASTFYCAVCTNITLLPIVQENCEHTVCLGCFNGIEDPQQRHKARSDCHRRCPSGGCRARSRYTYQPKVNRALQLLLWGLRVSCRNEGCKTEPYLLGHSCRNEVHHRTVCLFEEVECKDCKKEMPRSAIATHECPARKVTCPDCQDELPQSEYAQHQTPRVSSASAGSVSVPCHGLIFCPNGCRAMDSKENRRVIRVKRKEFRQKAAEAGLSDVPKQCPYERENRSDLHAQCLIRRRDKLHHMMNECPRRLVDCELCVVSDIQERHYSGHCKKKRKEHQQAMVSQLEEFRNEKRQRTGRLVHELYDHVTPTELRSAGDKIGPIDVMSLLSSVNYTKLKEPYWPGSPSSFVARTPLNVYVYVGDMQSSERQTSGGIASQGRLWLDLCIGKKGEKTITPLHQSIPFQVEVHYAAEEFEFTELTSTRCTLHSLNGRQRIDLGLVADFLRLTAPRRPPQGATEDYARRIRIRVSRLD